MRTPFFNLPTRSIDGSFTNPNLEDFGCELVTLSKCPDIRIVYELAPANIDEREAADHLLISTTLSL
jgi:hypothetical protein